MQHAGGEGLAQRLGTGVDTREGAGGVQPHHAERTAVHEAHAGALARFEAYPFVPGGGLVEAGELPVAGHAKVDFEDGAVVQMQQLDLGSPLDAFDAEAVYRLTGRGGQGAALAGVQRFDTGNGVAEHGRAQASGGVFDFGELRHTGGTIT
ncbi:hypothetical protein [Gemmatimonas sp.]|uniref:hypothetical protein n=1 Tax=Gemmatimonas sp. TaxID=1962908 RepID=UPI0022C5D4CA|nr:hypothetical protein [Gemmatimonas sp.]MCZ8205197.1 hypothetical protein [Gemmatimonas sp.]